MGSEGNIYVAAVDHMIGELTFAPDELDETIEIANAHLRAPSLDQVWFDRIRDGVQQNMTAAQAQPAHAGFDAVRWAVFAEQPLRDSLSLDGPTTFQELTREDIVEWHRETFTITPAEIVVAGDIDAAAAGKAIDKLLFGLPEGRSPKMSKAQPDYSPKRIVLHIPDAETTTLSFIAPLPATRFGNELEDLILLQALGGDDQSALFKAVRTELRASYSFVAGMANYTRDLRIMYMSGEVEADMLSEVETAVRDAYKDFRNTNSWDDLDARKGSLNASFENLPSFFVDQARSEIQSGLDGFVAGRSLSLTEELAAVTEQTIVERLNNGFPSTNEFIVVAVTSDADALPGACVITTPSDVVECD